MQPSRLSPVVLQVNTRGSNWVIQPYLIGS